MWMIEIYCALEAAFPPVLYYSQVLTTFIGMPVATAAGAYMFSSGSRP